MIAGHVGLASYGFPTTPGTYDQTPDEGGSEAFAARLSADLSRLEWAATFGGDDFDDTLDMLLDAQDRPVLVGFTNSRDFPTTPGAVDRLCNDSSDWYDCPDKSDGFATKMAADGSALLWSTYIGGYGDDVAYAVASDAQGDIYLTGTTSHEGTFPLKDPYQATMRRDPASCERRWYCDDAFLVRLSSAGSLVHGTLLGGGSQDAGHGVRGRPRRRRMARRGRVLHRLPGHSDGGTAGPRGRRVPALAVLRQPRVQRRIPERARLRAGPGEPAPASTAQPAPTGQSARAGSVRRTLTVGRRGRRVLRPPPRRQRLRRRSAGGARARGHVGAGGPHGGCGPTGPGASRPPPRARRSLSPQGAGARRLPRRQRSGLSLDSG